MIESFLRLSLFLFWLVSEPLTPDDRFKRIRTSSYPRALKITRQMTKGSIRLLAAFDTAADHCITQ